MALEVELAVKCIDASYVASFFLMIYTINKRHVFQLPQNFLELHEQFALNEVLLNFFLLRSKKNSS